jgi:hypothetical protein
MTRRASSSSTDPAEAPTATGDSPNPGEWLPRALLLDPVAIPGDAACFADARALGLTDVPILLGWRRAGGALVLGASDGAASLELLAATKVVVAATTEWTDARWDAAFRSFWSTADPELRNALAERLPLPRGSWTLASWSETVWGAYAGGVESAALAVLGAAVPEEVRQGVGAMGSLVRAAAFVFEPFDEARVRIRCTLVAGELDPIAERSLPGEMDGAAKRIRRGLGRPRVLDEVLPAIERVAMDSGARPTWSRRDWVRFEGPRGAVRVFPREQGVWLQLVGADEGARAGLWFRHGLPKADDDRSRDAPPGTHMFLRDADALTPAVEALLRHWLRGPEVEKADG